MRAPQLAAFPALSAWIIVASSLPARQIANRVRANDAASASLLSDALTRSATVRGLAGQIQRSDVLVMLALSNDRTVRGLTQFSAAENGIRILVTRITTFLNQDERIAVLAHELQHACEIAAAPEVTSDAAVRQLFDRIGDQTSWAGDRYETAAALHVERQVREELRVRVSSRSAAPRPDRSGPPFAPAATPRSWPRRRARWSRGPSWRGRLT
jgi:hypothetical protein